MSDWRIRDTSRDWSKVTEAEKFRRTVELSVEAFRATGIHRAGRMDKSVIRCVTVEQMNYEDDALECVLAQNRD